MKRLSQIFAFIFLAAALISACQPQSQPETSPSKTPVSEIQLLWELKLGDKAMLRPPLVVGNTLLALFKNGDLQALDRFSGEVLWKYSGGPFWESSLAVNDEYAYLATRDGVLHAITLKNGKKLWERAFNFDFPVPIFATNDALYFGTTFIMPTKEQAVEGIGVFWKVDPLTGETIWSFKNKDHMYQTPYIKGDRVYVGASFVDQSKPKVSEGGWMHVYALSAKDGSVIWTHEGEDGFVKSIYATDEAVAYVAYTDYVIALDPKTGEKIWKQDTGNWTPSLVGADGVIYTSSANTNVFAWQAKDGKSVWLQNLAGGSFNYVLGSPVILKDSVIVLSQRGDLYSFNRQSGDLIWSYATKKTAQIGPAALEDGYLYFGDQYGYLYAYRYPTNQ